MNGAGLRRRAGGDEMTKHKMAIAALAAALLAAGTGLSGAESFEPNYADNLKES